MNLQDPTVLKYYNTAVGTFFFFICAAMSLERHLICLSEEHVSAVCNPPFKRHGPAFVEHSDEPLFPSLGKASPRSQSGSRKKGHEEGTVNCFQVPPPRCSADTVSCGKKWSEKWKSLCLVAVHAASPLSGLPFENPSSSLHFALHI